jgi:hypothetical protein
MSDKAMSDKAMTGKPSAVAQQPSSEETVKKLGLLFQELLKEATNSAVLKIQQSAAQKEFEKRQSDFTKSEAIHDKFPAIEECQKRNKDNAESKLKTISKEVVLKDSKLNDIAVQSAACLMPHIVAAGLQANQDQLISKSRFEELEKKCETFQKQYLDMKSYAEQIRKSHEQLETSHKELRSSLEEKVLMLEANWTSARQDWGQTQSALTEFKDQHVPKLNQALNRVKVVEDNYDSLKQTATKLACDIPKDLKHKVEKLEKSSEGYDTLLPKLKDDVGHCVEEVKEVSSTFTKHIKSIERLGADHEKLEKLHLYVHGGSNPDGSKKNGLKDHVSGCMTDQGLFREELLKLDSSTHTLLAGKTTTNKDDPSLSKLEIRVKETEDKLAGVATLSGRLCQLEKVMPEIDIKVRAMDKLGSINTSTIPQQSDSPACSPRFTLLENRVGVIERYFTGTSGHGMGLHKISTDYPELISRLKLVEERVADMPQVKDQMMAIPLLKKSIADISADISKDIRANQESIAASVKEKRENDTKVSGELAGLKNVVNAAALGSDVIKLQLRVDEVEKKLERDANSRAVNSRAVSENGSRASPLASVTPAQDGATATPQAALDALKADILQIVTSQQEAADDAAGEIFTRLQNDSTQLQNDIQITTNDLKQFQVSLDVTLRQLFEKDSLTEKDVESLKQQMNIVAKNQQDFDQRLEISGDAWNSIQKRIDNIATKDMALFILSQMDATYPDLRNWQDTLQALKASYSRLETTIAKGVGGEDKALRDEVNGLAKELVQTSAIATAANSTATAAKTAADSAIATNETFQVDYAAEIAGLRVDVNELQEQQKQKVKNSASLQPSPRPTSRQTAAISPSVLNGTNSRPKASAFQTTQRQSSMQSEPGSGSSRKRKMNNGSISDIKLENIKGSKANGAGAGAHGSPKAKKRKGVEVVASDADEDEEFEVAAPRIDDDDELD